MDNHQMTNTDSEFILYFSTLNLNFFNRKGNIANKLKKKVIFLINK